jgi:hypothetical protein
MPLTQADEVTEWPSPKGVRLPRFDGRFSANKLVVGYGVLHVDFVGYWRPVSQTGMQPGRIVPTLDIAEAGHPGFSAWDANPAAAEQLGLEVEKKLSAMALS